MADSARQHAAHDLLGLGGERGGVAAAAVAKPEPRLGGLRLSRQRRLDDRRTAGESRQRRRVEALVGDQPAQAGAGEAQVFVGGIANIGETARLAKGDELRLGEPEQRARDLDLAAPAARRHAGEPGDAGATQQPEQHGLGLIVEMMRGDDDGRADPPRLGGKQIVARRARALLQPRRRLFALPDQRCVRDAEARAELRHRRRFRRAFRSERVVDGGGVELGAGPFRRHRQQRRRIGAAGDGQQQRRLVPQRVERRTAHEQRCAWISRSAERLTKPGADG